MPSIVSSNFRVMNARKFLSFVDSEKLYAFIGRSIPWSLPNSDTNPPVPEDSCKQANFINWDDMLAAKKVTTLDVCLAVKRHNWIEGQTYVQYSIYDKLIHEKAFYVYTDQGNVYKCIFNNNNAPSTVRPSEISPNVFSTSDGYKWKYMYSVFANNAERFTTNRYVYCPEESNASNIDNTFISVDNMFPGGHGSNIPKELGAHYIIVGIRLVGSENNKFFTDNDYRKIGLVSNPTLNGSSVIATGEAYKTTWKLIFTGNTQGTFTIDSPVTVAMNGVSPFLAYPLTSGIDTSTGKPYIEVSGNSVPILAGAVITSSDSGASGTVMASIPPELKKYSGDVIFVENRAPIFRTPQQTEALNIVLEF